MKKLNITLLLLLFTTLTFANENLNLLQLPPVRGIGVVVKKRPSNGSTKVVTTNNDGEVAIKITQAGDYTFSYPKPELLSKEENIKLGFCNNKVGLVDSYYTPNSKGEIDVKNIKPGVYALKLINSALGVCPEGYKLKDGICIVETTLINGKQIYVGCSGGKMYCLERYIGNDGIGRTTGADAADCPQGGQPCTGTWLHQKCGMILTDPIVISDDSPVTPTEQAPIKPIGTANLNPRKPSLDIIIGAGTFNPNTELTEKAYLQNMTSATLGLRLSVLSKDWWDLGIKLKGTYLTGNKDQVNPIPSPYNVGDQTSTSVAYTSKDSPRQTGMLVEVGPELNINIVAGLVLSAGVDLGYAKIKNSEFSIIQTLDYNATVTTYPLLWQKETEISGLSVTPNLNLKYRLGRVSIYTALNYVVLPKVNTVGSSFLPNGIPNAQNIYLYGQMQDGAVQPWQKNLSGGAINISGGVIINISKKSDYVGHVTLLR